MKEGLAIASIWTLVTPSVSTSVLPFMSKYLTGSWRAAGSVDWSSWSSHDSCAIQYALNIYTTLHILKYWSCQDLGPPSALIQEKSSNLRPWALFDTHPVMQVVLDQFIAMLNQNSLKILTLPFSLWIQIFRTYPSHISTI
jgi:hypothetical protein